MCLSRLPKRLSFSLDNCNLHQDCDYARTHPKGMATRKSCGELDGSFQRDNGHCLPLRHNHLESLLIKPSLLNLRHVIDLRPCPNRIGESLAASHLDSKGTCQLLQEESINEKSRQVPIGLIRKGHS
jgi:hypothetical protein